MLALAIVLAGCDATETETARSGQPPPRITGLYPAFDSDRSLYVSRCGRGAAPIAVHGDEDAVHPAGSGAESLSAQPGHDFTIRLDEEGDPDRAYRVRCLPADFPKWRFQRLEDPGHGMFVVAFRASPDERPWVIVFDHDGAPRWWYSPPTRVLWAQVLHDGTIAWARSFGDGYGIDPRMAHEIRSPSGALLRVVRTRGTITDGHELLELPNGNLLLVSYSPAGRIDLRHVAAWKKRRPPDRGAVAFAEIQEVDPRGRVAWRWNSRGRIRLGETGRWWRSVLVNPKPSRFGETFDPVHINSVERRGDQLVISSRHTDAVYGIDRSTGQIAWKLGGKRTSHSLRVLGDPAARLLGGPHDARFGADGRLTVFDNGKGRPRLPRVVSYRLDLKRRTATYIGQLTDAPVTGSHCCGSARRLSGGGWLVSWGDNPLVTGFDAGGQPTFRLHLPTATFRAVPVPEGATSIAALDRGLEQLERGSASHGPRD